MATSLRPLSQEKSILLPCVLGPIPSFPDVSTYKAQGVDFDQWTGWSMYVLQKMPKPIVEKLANALKETINDPAVAEKFIEGHQC